MATATSDRRSEVRRDQGLPTRPVPRRRPATRGPAVTGPRTGAARGAQRPGGVPAPELARRSSVSGRLSIRASHLPEQVTRVSTAATTGAVRLTDRGIAVVLGTGAALMLTSICAVVATALSVTG